MPEKETNACADSRSSEVVRAMVMDRGSRVEEISIDGSGGDLVVARKVKLT